MKKIFLLTTAFLISVLLAACGNGNSDSNIAVDSTENPEAEEVLNLDPEADIFQFNDVIYTTGIDWVEGKKLTKNKQIGKIKEKNEDDTDFSNGTANKLPVGAIIYTTKEENDMFLIVDSDGETKKYYALVEG